MKNTMKLMLVALMAFSMVACGNRIKEEDLKKAEASLFNDNNSAEAALFNEDMSANMEVAPAVVEKFCKFVEQNPDAPTAPDWLFKALEISINLKDAEKSEMICDKLIKDYPTFDKTPVGMFMMASFVYEDQLRDLDKARSMYEKIIADYPESEFVPSVEAALKNLGKTPEEIVMEFEAAAAAEENVETE